MKYFNSLKKIVFILLLLYRLPISIGQTIITDIDAKAFKDSFNVLKDYPRIVLILDPLCGGCIASADDFENFILPQCSNPNLKIMVVWVKTPGFPSKRSDAVNRANSWTEPRAIHFWNSPSDDIPKAFGPASWTSCNYAWDFQIIYNPGDTWTTVYPPSPAYCMSKTNCCSSFNKENFLMAMSSIAVCSPSEIENTSMDLNKISIYPNPSFNSSITINYSMNSPKGTIIITDLPGKLINTYELTNEKGEIMLNEKLSSGFYICTFYKQGQPISKKKIIIN